uniref:Ovule protein n=1 Tax=Steinernema glaseri TaxID=37863 RepID=A0A1I8A1E8_9BILA
MYRSDSQSSELDPNQCPGIQNTHKPVHFLSLRTPSNHFDPLAFSPSLKAPPSAQLMNFPVSLLFLQIPNKRGQSVNFYDRIQSNVRPLHNSDQSTSTSANKQGYPISEKLG